MAEEKRVPVRAVRVTKHCPKCGEELVYRGQVYLSSPPKYEHEARCGRRQTFSAQYPCIEFENLN